MKVMNMSFIEKSQNITCCSQQLEKFYFEEQLGSQYNYLKEHWLFKQNIHYLKPNQPKHLLPV